MYIVNSVLFSFLYLEFLILNFSNLNFNISEKLDLAFMLFGGVLRWIAVGIRMFL